MKLSLYTDGGSRGNPGPAAAGVVVFDEKNDQLLVDSKYLGETTNNQAEYQALILGLTCAAKIAAPAKIHLHVFMDSELIIRQMNGEYRVKDESLKPLYAQVLALAEGFAEISFTHVRREKNAVADRLVNEELDKRS